MTDTPTRWGHAYGAFRHIVDPARTRPSHREDRDVPLTLCSGADIVETSVDAPETMRMLPCGGCLTERPMEHATVAREVTEAFVAQGTWGAVVRNAKTIARQAHSGQVDRQGHDYYAGHLTRVAGILRPYGPEAEAAGWLHDVIEDTWLTADDLLGMGIPEKVVDTVATVTRPQGMPYLHWIRDVVAIDRLAVIVKLADNWDNLSNMDFLAEADPGVADSLRGRYMAAREILTTALIGGTV